MNQELQKYYEDRFDLFSRQGWLDLIEDVEAMLDSMNNVSTITDATTDKAVWATYRQALRDVTTQTGFPWTITWPDAP
jgi:hypothetical protein